MSTELEKIGVAIKEMLDGRDVAPFIAVLAPDIVWGECSGVGDVVASLELANEDWTSMDEQSVSIHADRLIVRVAGTFDGRQIEAHNVMFERDGLVYEIRDSLSQADALLLRPLTEILGDPPPFLQAAVPVLPVSDLGAAIEDYVGLGFVQSSLVVDDEVVLESGAVTIHLGLDEEAREFRAKVHLAVSDAEAIFARWHAAKPAGELIMPVDDGRGCLVGAYLDVDENLIRFASPINELSHTH